MDGLGFIIISWSGIIPWSLHRMWKFSLKEYTFFRLNNVSRWSKMKNQLKVQNNIYHGGLTSKCRAKTLIYSVKEKEKFCWSSLSNQYDFRNLNTREVSSFSNKKKRLVNACIFWQIKEQYCPDTAKQSSTPDNCPTQAIFTGKTWKYDPNPKCSKDCFYTQQNNILSRLAPIKKIQLNLAYQTPTNWFPAFKPTKFFFFIFILTRQSKTISFFEIKRNLQLSSQHHALLSTTCKTKHEDDWVS